MGGHDVILIRHAEADYDTIAAHDPIFSGARRDLAPLTAFGITQTQRLAGDLRSTALRLIISSPYTRALQTAGILAKELACDLAVDVRLHDWLPVRDATDPISASVVRDKIDEYERWTTTGDLPPGRTWETTDEMRRRLLAVVNDFHHKAPVALVAHEAPIQAVIGPVVVPVASAHQFDPTNLRTESRV